jgi:hypothetical protein
MSAGKDQTTEPMAPGPAPAPVLSPELEMVLQQPPPREAPGAFKSALRRKVLGTAVIMFFIGLIFSIVGGIIVGVMFPWQVAKDIKLATGAKAQAVGTVTNLESTNYRENRTRVIKISYEFQTPDGKTLQGVSYQTGGMVMPGAEIQVEYLASDPEISRGVGMRMNAIGYFILIFIFFPVIGFSLLIYSVYYWRSQMSKGVRLFSHGALTQGTVSSVDKTNVRVNNQYRFKVTVSYMNFQTFYYAYGQDVMTASNWQGARTPLRVLYNPEKPDDAFVVESILK